MNKFKKYCPNVWVAECEEEYEKGEIIELETQYGKIVECEVYNFLGKDGEEQYKEVVLNLPLGALEEIESWANEVENEKI